MTERQKRKAQQQTRNKLVVPMLGWTEAVKKHRPTKKSAKDICSKTGRRDAISKSFQSSRP